MNSFLEWLSSFEKNQLFLENLLVERRSSCQDIEIIRHQINRMFDDAIQDLLKNKIILNPSHISQAKQAIGNDWWGYLIKTMKEFPYKGPDLYDAATHLAGDLWEKVFNIGKYNDRNPPLAVFHKMASIRGQDIAFRFFGWRRKLKTSNMSDIIGPEDTSIFISKGDMFSDLEWHDLQEKLLKAVEKETKFEKNKERASRAVDVIRVKLTGFSKIYKKQVTDTGLDGLAAFYHVNRREMYDTLLIVYRAIREMAKDITDNNGSDILKKVMDQLPASLCRDPEETILNLIPPSPQEISHSDLFTKAYSANRELKSLTFKEIIQKLLDRNKISTRKDDRLGKRQILYMLAS